MTNQPRSARVFFCQHKYLSVISSLNQSQSFPSSHLGPSSCFSSCFHFYTRGREPEVELERSGSSALVSFSRGPPSTVPRVDTSGSVVPRCPVSVAPDASSRDWLPKNCYSSLPLWTTGIRCHWFYSYCSGRPSSPLL